MKTVSQDSVQHDRGHIPKFMKFSPFILRGYRVNYSWRQLLLSLFGWHNETVNVWTHLLPFLCILALVFSSSVAVQHYHDRHEIAAYAREVEAQRNIFAAGHSLNTSLEAESEHSSALFDHVVRFYLTPVSAISRSVDQLMRLTVEDRLPIRDTIANTGRKIEEVGQQIDELTRYWTSQRLNKNYLSLDIYPDKLLEIQQDLVYYSSELIDSIVEFSEQANPQSKWPIQLYLFCASAAMSTSVAYHLFYPLSPEFYKTLIDLDFAGVTFMNIGCTFPVVIYSSTCNTAPIMTYLPVLTVLNLGAYVLRIMGRIKNSPPVYGIIGIISLAPITHIIAVQQFFDNFGDTLRFSQFLPTYLLSGAFVLGGLAMMIFECPQRKAPGRFDYCGAGHQIWHICSVIGMVLQLSVIWQLYHLRRLSPCPCPISYH